MLSCHKLSLRSWKLVLSLILICFTAILHSCAGYQVGQCSTLSTYETISVPYVTGDTDGGLTAAIVHEIVSDGCLSYRPTGGALVLNAQVVNSNDENIGFRYDRHKDGRLQHYLIPVESRMSIIVEFSVVEAASDTIVMGPVQLYAYVDLDHDYNADRNPVDSKINVKSLGQLTNADEAFEAAKRPLNSAMARKIANYISHSW